MDLGPLPFFCEVSSIDTRPSSLPLPIIQGTSVHDWRELNIVTTYCQVTEIGTWDPGPSLLIGLKYRSRILIGGNVLGDTPPFDVAMITQG